MADANNCERLQDRTWFPKPPQEIAPALLKQAGSKVLALRDEGDFALQFKEGNYADLVTKGDCTSQNLIFGTLQTHYPSHAFFGEEKCVGGPAATGPTKGEDVLWILDPIDGTTNYVHGSEYFSILLSVVVGGEICYGAVYWPAHHELFWAVRGKGAYHVDAKGKQTPLHVSPTASLKKSFLITGFKAGKPDKVAANMAVYLQVESGVVQAVRRNGSAGLDLAQVARGTADGFWEGFMDWWDISAGMLLVEEAGGKTWFIPQDGATTGTRKFTQPTLMIMASNGQAGVHNAMQQLLETHRGAFEKAAQGK